jgi:hypothetical protein
MELRLSSARLHLFKRSLVISADAEFGLAQTEIGRKLAVLPRPDSSVTKEFEGETNEFGKGTLLLCPLSHHNAETLRTHLTWLQPQLIGLRTSAGMGDRLGIATPGHVRAVRNSGSMIAPIFAQQSMREMSRTGRTPQMVMDEATWGIFEEGWQGGVGADADHLKTRADIEVCNAAGFTFYTIDPGEFVNNFSQVKSSSQLNNEIETLPGFLQPIETGLVGKSFDIEGHQIHMDEEALLRAILKYGQAVAHVVEMFEHLSHVARKQPFEVEVSMDETEQPTSPAEHVYIASELRRLGVKWVSFAPRFVGRFEKGVDYIGDLRSFQADLAVHAAIARQLGPYKLSLHSGSDKFSIYSVFMEETKSLAHLKTAGTSYLEALRTFATVDIELLKGIYAFALEHYETDKRSYHVSAQLNRAPKPDKVVDWPGLLEQFDTREILHVTFGSVLKEKTGDGMMRFYDRIMSDLQQYRESYFDNLEKHFKRHLQPFSTLNIA